MKKTTLTNDVKGQDKGQNTPHGFNRIVVREFEPADEEAVHLIFYEGMMEMIPDTAFRALKYHPECLLLYAAMTGEISFWCSYIFKVFKKILSQIHSVSVLGL